MLLRQAIHVADLCASLQGVVDAEGPLSSNRLGEVKAHPALVELRAQRLLLARLVVALRVPLGDQEEDGEDAAVVPGRRSGRLPRRGIRGVYAGGAA
ncbi:MAG TPA: hypothetical protein VFB94_17255 [Acidimicrobiales bacterium]|nr:hypothetical protein [Acidimicrobiales bacterium]